MISGVTVTNTKALTAQLQRFADESLGDLEQEVLSQFRSALRFAISITPPGMGNQPYEGTDREGNAKTYRGATGAKKRGEDRVEKDLLKIFRPGKKGDSKVRSIAAMHKSCRDTRGRVRRDWGTRKATAPAAELKSYIRMRQSHVGWAASGWLVAAQAAELRVPAWIARHKAPGMGDFRVTGTSVVARAANQVPWLTRSAPEFQRRLDYAMVIQAKKLSREIDHLLTKRAKSLNS